VLGHEGVLFSLVLTLAPLPMLVGVLAYVGLGPGQEFIPYFFGLLAFAAAALMAVLQWPLSVLRRYFGNSQRERPKEVAAIPRQADE
jgi:hypothetical protein